MATMSPVAGELGVPSSSRLKPGFQIRRATTADTKAMADLFFTSFNPSHKFWEVFTPADDPKIRDWWVEAWRLGIEEDPSVVTFVAVDEEADNRIVGFARWVLPQPDGSIDRLWPDFESVLDMSIASPFFDGMHENRAKLMGTHPHWMLEMLGTDSKYWGNGIGYTFVKWGCDHADAQDMEVYIDASEKGAPFYQRHFGAVPREPVAIEPRPESFGTFTYVSHVVPRKSQRQSASS